MKNFLQDLRYGARKLRKSVGPTAVAVLTLALGLAIITSIFSLVDSILLSPLPHPQPERLVRLWEKFAQEDPERRFNFSENELVDLRDQARSFEALAGYTLAPRNLTGVQNPEQVPVASVSPAFFSVLGARPDRGRAFLPDEEQPAKALVAVLSHESWQRRFGADPNVLGRTIDLDGQRFTVVGVMPEGFRSPGKLEPWGSPELWVPEVIDRANLAAERWGRRGRNLEVIARLRPGVSQDQAR